MTLKKALLGFFIFNILFLLPYNAEASPFLNRGSGTNFNDQVTSWTDGINGFAPTISFLFNSLFTIMFLVGIVRMGYSIVTKTGQVMKFSTGILIWIPITFFFIRLLIIFLFTTNKNNVTLFASDIISLFKSSGYFTSIGMVLIGLVLFLFYRLIEHPEFGRWSKRLWVSAALLTVLTTVMPYVLGAS